MTVPKSSASQARLTQCLHRAVQLAARSVATIDAGRRRSWADVRERVARAAAGLRSLGLRAGQAVAVLSANSDAYLELQFAVAWAGGVFVPLNTRLAPSDLQFMLRDSAAAILCVDGERLPEARAWGRAEGLDLKFVCLGPAGEPGPGSPGVPGWESLIAGHAPMDDDSRCGDALAAICYTGGSTGRPKGVMLSHGNLMASAVNACTQIGYDEGAVYLHAAPMFHLTDGMSTLAVTLAGGRHVLVPKFEPAQVLRAIELHRVTHVTLVPTMISLLLQVPGIEAMQLSSLRQLMFGSAPIPAAVLQRAVEIWPQLLFLHGWGMTELSPLGTLLPAPLRDPQVAGERLQSCGRAMPNLELRIVDEHGRERPRGMVGEIVVRGPSVMQGYWNMPEQSALAVRDGWFHTGDSARMDEGGLVYIVDRLKDMIISGGENIYSTEVENALSLMPGVAEVAVIGIPDDQWGEIVHAIVVPREGASFNPSDVVAFARTRLAGYKIPRSVSIQAASLPVSGAGKVLKSELRAPYWQSRERKV